MKKIFIFAIVLSLISCASTRKVVVENDNSTISKYRIPVVTEYEDIDIFIYENCKADYEVVLITNQITPVKMNWQDPTKYRLSRYNQGIIRSDAMSAGRYCPHMLGYMFENTHTWTCGKVFRVKTFRKDKGLYSIIFEI